MIKPRLWTDKENLFLKKYYPIKGSKYVAKALKRTRNAVWRHASTLGVDGSANLPYHPYSPQEIIFIKKYYPLKGSKYVGKLLGRSPSSIKDKARKMRVERKSLLQWSKDEIEYLRRWYNKKRPSVIAHHLKRTTPAIVTRARMVGILRRQVRLWNIGEEVFLIRNFRKMTYKQIGKCLNRTESSVSHKAKAMLTMRKLKTRKWEPQEKRLLSRLYGKIPVAELAARLNRTPGSVLHRARLQKKTAKGAPVFSEKEKEFIRNNYLRMTNVQIGKKLNRPASSIPRVAKKFGLTGNPEKRRLWERAKRAKKY
ncbi:MAG: hypothetical protein Q8M94_11525 [Ignavibacteria bacterium]|nr:hypothetical protein [Ignavibacteria bacterium]